MATDDLDHDLLAAAGAGTPTGVRPAGPGRPLGIQGSTTAGRPCSRSNTFGHAETVAVLLDAGADLGAEDNRTTALMLFGPGRRSRRDRRSARETGGRQREGRPGHDGLEAGRVHGAA